MRTRITHTPDWVKCVGSSRIDSLSCRYSGMSLLLNPPEERILSQNSS
jgi:hypothetical protein